MKALLKLEFKSTFKLSKLKDKKSRNKFLLKALIYIVLAILAIMLSVQASIGLIDIGFENLIFEGVTPIALVITFFIILYKQFSLYKRSDYDMLVSLPIKTSQIVLSKLSIFLLQIIIISSVIYIPAGIVYGFYKGVGILYYLMLLVVSILVPMLPFSLALLLGTLISYISSSIKSLSSGMKIFVRIMIALFFGIIIVIYMLSMANMENTLNQEMIINTINSSAEVFSVVWFINNILYNLDIGIFLVYLIFNILIFLLTLKITSIFFTKINLKYLESKSNDDYKVNNLKMNSKFFALLKVEIKRYFSIFIYVFNTLPIAIMALVCALVVVFLPAESISSILNIPKSDYTNLIVNFLPLITVGILSLVNTTNASISLEGNTFWINSSIPIEPRLVYLSKIAVNLLISLPISLISTVIFLFKFDIGALGFITLFLTPISVLPLVALVGILLNIKYPKMDFQNPTEVVKQGTPVLLSMIIGIVIDIALIFVLMIFSHLGLIVLDMIFIILTKVLWDFTKKINLNSIIKE